jgi:hypothetical protein
MISKIGVFPEGVKSRSLKIAICTPYSPKPSKFNLSVYNLTSNTVGIS